MKIGIDAGGTLIKIVKEEAETRTYETKLTTDIDEVIEWLDQVDCESISLTGGNAALINARLSCPSRVFVEFDAAAKGVEMLLQEQGHDLDNYIFTNVGTGTSLHYSDGNGQQRVGGIGTGGGMIQGLGYLLTNIQDYEELTNLAQQGDRDKIDLKVKHIYKDTEPPIPGDLTAANFGNVLNHVNDVMTLADKLASVIGVVGEVVTTMAITVAREYQTENVAYIGSSFHNNPLLKSVIEDYTVLRGFKPYTIDNGAFSGALGAIHL
ncbi:MULTISPECIES: type II pantothenate kinase [Staphylococcus]|uniref:Type II pantothenate kinase n=1 Tax=Staphylococcus pettenkoferi TaxID=170573 RepID=A0A2N6QCF2_9STAP|nr:MULTISPECIES: type II pantothenate kinase [Staphylococcus]MBX8994334.1 type II pantothenate kinase [Staphylococcus pettenkoferi]MCI2792257.1 type II pantothenate kinase [Staphylococcus pettenkoferi]MCY1567723.1 type II pantothenate kinase [Staphylococcus pettenkoferi]MCY1588637.1 type II pantothenate kinase [Staphylococcus pettenkoferi]MCY1604589.1 type II pantothenate kinase [Staphylococcus pettenkoferi]